MNRGRMNSRRKFIKIGGITTLASLSGIGFTFAQCREPHEIDENNLLSISGVSIPSSIDVIDGEEITISGKGFQVGDTMLFESVVDGKTYSSMVSLVTDREVSFPVPASIITGGYKLTVSREQNSLFLGSLVLNLVSSTELPDKEGMTVKGVVYSSGVGIAGVVVSDGFEVTLTDDEGRYYLPSQKKTGFVFVSIPGNYEVLNNGNAPQFFQRLSANKEAIERKDFSLIATNNENHVVIPMADWHLANRNNDLDQFTNKILPDVNATIDKYAAEGAKVYVLTLGDMTWELYWYNNDFGLNEYIPYMNKLNSPVFNLIGNHDYHPYIADDWDASAMYRNVLGPTYYSFNLGKVHYVVLDDVEYLNEGASEGVIGKRNYRDVIESEQMEWLKKDLAAITDKSTPIIIATHTPLYRNPKLDSNNQQVNEVNLENGHSLIAALKEFSTVHVLTGHTHINYRVDEELNLMEHNIAAVSATWWWTGRNGYAGNHICKDGSPGGYGVWKMKGRDIEWIYKSAGYAEDYQFRSYDLNTVYINAPDHAPNATDDDLAAFVGPYGQPRSSNEVLLNIWGYDNQWQIEVTENGKSLGVTRVTDLDPLHIISYEAFRVNAGANPTGAFTTTETSHLFRVVANAPDSTLQIKVTDRFGNVYKEEMIRPKAFNYTMS
ncbi:calcineurin-like phosphoesterase family protein [Marinoscillum pacificum]|uniref:calcineurin-like phosphoesterase family protein n=1 Tax=Marinoscillum pacificum TaxID=392723 RepID=UPI00215741EB|nr:calcineurin-like phosphoesterase family protein [Marinoscillum pacificum]